MKHKKYYKQECEKRGVSSKDIKRVEKIKNRVKTDLSLIIFIAFLLFILINLLGFNLIKPFTHSIKNIKWMAMLFSFLSTLFFIKGAFKNKYQIALESATILGSNDFVKKSLITQNVYFAWGFYMLTLSILCQMTNILVG